MKTESLMSCEHITLQAIPGRTEALVERVKAYLSALFALSDEFGSAAILVTLDGTEHRFEWLDDQRPGLTGDVIAAMDRAQRIDLRIDLCWDAFQMMPEQQALRRMLSDGSFKDCAAYYALMSDEHTASLVMSGLYHCAFLDGSVPFSGQSEDILTTTDWNGLTHRARFTLPEGRMEEAAALADELERRFEIDLSLNEEEHTLVIEALELKGFKDVHFYRDTLQKLLQLSVRALITGSLTPEDDRVFALLRFVQEGSQVIIQTAVAEA